MNESETIRQRLEAISRRPQGSPRPIAVYDLDSTLFHTGPRNHAILRAFAEIRPQLRPWAQRLDPQRLGWNIMLDLEATGFTDRPILDELAAYWRATFFTDLFVQVDEAYPGAVDLVKATREAGCLVYYLTGRDEPGMREGTLACLLESGFPVPDGQEVILHMKPTWDMHDLPFKEGVFRRLDQLGEVCLAFENDPTNANRFHRAYPQALVVLHETVEPPGSEPLDQGILRVRDLMLG